MERHWEPALRLVRAVDDSDFIGILPLAVSIRY